MVMAQNDSAGSAGDSGGCLGRTCLKWGRDGELTSLDMEWVLERLAKVDVDLAEALESTFDQQPCPSIS